MNEEKVWERIAIARNPKRPTAKILIQEIITDFIEFHGDRFYRDDPSLVCGIGFLKDLPLTIIGHEKGESTPDKIAHNFGMAHPEGYRKALRLMKQAEKFKRPILFIIDTPGAYPGIGAEERGQAGAIAANLFTMIDLEVPLIAVVLGEGGSGGALAIGVSDEIWMFENAIYSILSPEGFASILYKDASLAKQIAPTMKLTAQDLYDFKIIEEIIPEVSGGLHLDPNFSFCILKEKLFTKFCLLLKEDIKDVLKKRYEKYRQIGIYEMASKGENDEKYL
jgi:acetyl-CoA carboxylase carboxyl transferase subunit alpha